jgi:glutathione S-transferase
MPDRELIHDFNHAELWISARSPFARRVRLALLEHGLPYDERVLDVFRPPAELFALNPLGRVPVIRLRNGAVFFESEKILELIYRAHPASPLRPATLEDEATAEYWGALALGICEKTVEYFLNTLKPGPARDLELEAEIEGLLTRSLGRFDAYVSHAGQGDGRSAVRETIVPGRLTQADLDMGTALAYLTLRHPLPWQKLYPSVSSYFEKIDGRDSMRKTRPPA